jgi:F0F1-type ATP synthase membrane subunit b/b'
VTIRLHDADRAVATTSSATRLSRTSIPSAPSSHVPPAPASLNTLISPPVSLTPSHPSLSIRVAPELGTVEPATSLTTPLDAPSSPESATSAADGLRDALVASSSRMPVSLNPRKSAEPAPSPANGLDSPVIDADAATLSASAPAPGSGSLVAALASPIRDSLDEMTRRIEAELAALRARAEVADRERDRAAAECEQMRAARDRAEEARKQAYRSGHDALSNFTRGLDARVEANTAAQARSTTSSTLFQAFDRIDATLARLHYSVAETRAHSELQFSALDQSVDALGAELTKLVARRRAEKSKSRSHGNT